MRMFVATVVAAVMASAACAVPIRVNAYAERGVDVSRYRTFDFAAVDDVPTGDPRLDSNPFFNERVRAAAEKGLTDRGYVRDTSGAADLLVHFHASVAQDIDVVAADRSAGFCAQDACRPFAYDNGTLLMDLVDARTRALAWRGWAESSIDGVVDNQRWLEQRIDAAMARVTARMPRAGGAATNTPPVGFGRLP